MIEKSGSVGVTGAVVPGSVVPGSVVPGFVVPGSVVPGFVVPGSVVPGFVVPGSVIPGSVVPGVVSGVSSSGSSSVEGVEGLTGGRAALESSTYPVEELTEPSAFTDIMSRSLRAKVSTKGLSSWFTRSSSSPAMGTTYD